MELSKISHAAQRKAFELALSAALKKTVKDVGRDIRKSSTRLKKCLETPGNRKLIIN